MDLSEIILVPGSHSNRSYGVCAMEAVAWLAGEEHSDTPECVNLYVRSVIILLNDRGGDHERDKLKYYLPHVIGLDISHEVTMEIEGYLESLRSFYPFLPAMPQETLDEGFALLDRLVGESVEQTDLQECVLA